jgi:TonB family protein
MKVILSVLAALLFAPAVFAQETAPKVIRGGVLNGKAVSLPKPEYPENAKNAGVEGDVRVEVTIDENGSVESAKALKEEEGDTDLAAETADARASLREAAERAAMEARFSPTLLSGQPVKVTGIIVYHFSLSGRFENDPKIVNGGVLNGKAVSLPRPEYPVGAKNVRAAGTVVVQITVDEYGNVVSATAVSGHDLLRSSAVAAAREARFEPVKLSGQPVKFTGVITYNFVLPPRQP